VRRDDSGMSLSELAVVMFVSAIVAALAAHFVITFARDANAATVTAGRVDSVRLALDTVERQVRSGDVLYVEPADSSCGTYGSGGNCLRVATEVDGTMSCVQFQLVPDPAGDGSYDLRTRGYSPSWASGGFVGAWRQVANGLAPPTSSVPPFTLEQQSGVGSQAVNVQFTASAATSASAPIKLVATFVPRNAVYGSSTACNGGAPT
jgi:prepilin-type N-terminal cleavage/methylation domain-containing protein